MTTRPPEFDARVEAYLPGLKKLALRYTRRDYRDDLVTDTIMYALENWQKFRGDLKQDKSGLWMWLAWTMRGISTHGARNAAARRKRITLVPIGDATRSLGFASNQHERLEVNQAIQMLSTVRDGDVVLQRAMGDSLEEIAVQRGVTKQRIHQIEIASRRVFHKRNRLLKVAA